jgi:hypothetical protein
LVTAGWNWFRRRRGQLHANAFSWVIILLVLSLLEHGEHVPAPAHGAEVPA